MTTPAHACATEALYLQHLGWLVARLRRKIGAWDAADLAQSTFLRLLAMPGRPLPALDEPRAYLTTIAQRLLFNHRRRGAAPAGKRLPLSAYLRRFGLAPAAVGRVKRGPLA